MEEKLEQIVAWNVINFPITCKIARYKLRTTDLETIGQLAPPGTPRHGIQFLVTAFTRNILPASWRRNNNSTAFLLFSRTHSSLYRRELHPRVHGLPRKRPSSFPTMASREGGRHSSKKFIARPSASTTSATLYSQGKIHEKAKSRPAVVSIGNGIRQWIQSISLLLDTVRLGHIWFKSV